jgi:hypothetical protein
MSYVVELNKHPSTLMRELFNHFNDTNYSEVELTVGSEPKPSPLEPYNTVVDVTLVGHPETADVPYASIHFNRIDLATLFSVVEVKLREVDIKADGSFDEVLVLQEVARKYGINTESGMFGVKQIEGHDVFFAKVNNPAFVGYSPLVIELSLDSRIGYRELNGFELTTEVVIDDVYVKINNPTYADDRFAYASVAVGDVVFMHGGRRASPSTPNSAFFRYDYSTNTWTSLGSPLISLNHSMCTDGEYLYVMGAGQTARQFIRYSLSSRVWVALPSLPGQFASGVSSNIAYHNKKVYYYFGTQVAAFDTVSGSWELAFGGMRDLGYYFGGKTIGKDWYLVYHDGFSKLDLTTGELTDIPGGLVKRQYAAVTTHGNNVYISSSNSANFEKYNTITGEWSTLTGPVPTRSQHGIAAVTNKVIFMPGYKTSDIVIYG